MSALTNLFNKNILEAAYAIRKDIKELEKEYNSLIEQAKTSGILEEGDYRLLLERETEVLDQDKFRKKYPAEFLKGATITSSAAKKLVAPAELLKKGLLSKELQPYVQVKKIA